VIRAVIFSATIAALVMIWLDQPSPVKTTRIYWCQSPMGNTPCANLPSNLNSAFEI
jgi:hypothetical protein